MASSTDMAALTAAINSLLDLPGSNQLLKLNSPTCERAFEAYVFALCGEAVRRASGTYELRGINSGPKPNPVVFRGAPGSMSSTKQNFVYAACQLKQKRFEIHVDVEYQGSSGRCMKSTCHFAMKATPKRSAVRVAHPRQSETNS
jgi:hypothetical protein